MSKQAPKEEKKYEGYEQPEIRGSNYTTLKKLSFFNQKINQ